MITLEKGVPSVYVDESRDFQYFLRAYDAVFNMVKNDTDTLKYLTSTKECQNKVLSLLKTKLGFFTNYSFNDNMLRGILAGFPTMIKNKGSLEAIQQALSIFLKVLNIRTEIILKVTGSEAEIIKGSIEVDDHTILVAINSAIQNFYILEELFRYIMPVGYQYSFYFYKEIEEASWILDRSTGRFLIINTLVSDSIRTHTLYNSAYDYSYNDPFVDQMVNQVNTINLYDHYEEDESLTITNEDFVMVPLTFEPECFENDYYFFYKFQNNKYVQLTSPETFDEMINYYIPQFLFFNDKDNDINGVYQLLTTEPEPKNITLHDGSTYSIFQQEYFNYYKLENGMYKNLSEPVPFEANKYYQTKPKKVQLIANDVISYSSLPLTATYISTVAELTNN